MKTAAVSKKSAARPKAKPKSTPKTSPTDTKKPRKPLIVIAAVILLLVVLAAGGLLMLQRHRQQAQAARDLQADRARFAAIEADMKRSYESIITTTGQPAKMENDKRCSHVAKKIEQGALRCLDYYELTFGFEDMNSAANHAVLLENALSSAGFAISSGAYTMSDFSANRRFDELITVNLHNRTNSYCQLVIRSGAVDDSSQYKVLHKDISNVYLLRCSAESGNAVYPLAE